VSETKSGEKVVNGIKAIKDAPAVLRLAMEICAKCGTCAKECPIYYGKSEKDLNPAARSDLIRKIYDRFYTPGGKLKSLFNGKNGAVTDEEIEEWSKAFYECTACRRCARFCPMGLDNSIVTRKGRALLDSIGKTPPFLLKVIEASLQTGNTDGAPPIALTEAASFLEEEILDEDSVAVRIPVDREKADVFFVPPSGDILVNPEAIMGTAKVFHILGIDWTMSSKAFDGANYGLFTGNDTAMKEDNKLYVEEAKRIGCKTLIMGECGHAHRIMKFMMEKAEWWGELPFEITNILQFTAKAIEDGKLKFDKSKNPDPVTYHDPCNFGRSCGITEEPRAIIRACCADYREMTPSGADNWCCGGGGGLSAMDSIQDFRMEVSGKKKVEQVKETGATYVASPCSNCKRQFTQLMAHHKMDVGTGGLHDLVSRAILY